jgi:hypothetical protein
LRGLRQPSLRGLAHEGVEIMPIAHGLAWRGAGGDVTTATA